MHDLKVVYICHPFRGYIAGNRERVRRIYAAVKRDHVPLAPHLMVPAYIVEATERYLALKHPPLGDGVRADPPILSGGAAAPYPRRRWFDMLCEAMAPLCLPDIGVQPEAMLGLSSYWRRQSTWKTFLEAHWDVLASVDFTTIGVWTRNGLVTYYLLFLMEVATRQVHFAGLTANDLLRGEIARDHHGRVPETLSC